MPSLPECLRQGQKRANLGPEGRASRRRSRSAPGGAPKRTSSAAERRGGAGRGGRLPRPLPPGVFGGPHGPRALAFLYLEFYFISSHLLLVLFQNSIMPLQLPPTVRHSAQTRSLAQPPSLRNAGASKSAVLCAGANGWYSRCSARGGGSGGADLYLNSDSPTP